jgi:uncharacterized protein (TIGR03000 family)
MEVCMKKFVALAALGLVALFVALPGSAAARPIGGIGRIGGVGRLGHVGPRAIAVGYGGYGLSRWPRFPRLFHRAWRTGYYYPDTGAWYSYPYTVYYPDAQASYSYPYTAYYPPDQAIDVNTVTIRMHVPSGAQVWFDGVATSRTGADREFVSPPLTPGREYIYHVRVQWAENGKTVERNRDVTVHAGDRINLNVDK